MVYLETILMKTLKNYINEALIKKSTDLKINLSEVELKRIYRVIDDYMEWTLDSLEGAKMYKNNNAIKEYEKMIDNWKNKKTYNASIDSDDLIDEIIYCFNVINDDYKAWELDKPLDIDHILYSKQASEIVNYFVQAANKI